MAYDASNLQSEDDQDPNKAVGQGADASGAAATSLSGGGGGFAGQTTTDPSGASQGASGPTSSGSWTNLNSYLDANKDQAAGIGQQIAGAVGGQAQKAQSDLGSVVSGFQNQDPFKQVNSTTSDQVNQAFADPTKYADAGANVSKPTKYLNNDWGFTPQTSDITQYGGASGAPSWQNTANEYGQANQSLQATQSESGRDGLLSQTYGQGGKNYNAGEQSFDQLLLQQNPDNQTALNGVYSQYAPAMGSDMGNAQTSAQQYAKDAQAKGAGFQTQAQGALGSDISGLGSTVGAETTARTASKAYDDNAYQRMAAEVQSGTLSDKQLTDSGASKGYMDLYGVDPSKYLTQNQDTFDGTANQAASGTDWSQFQGLQNLLAGGYKGQGQADAVSALGKTGLKGSPVATSIAPTTPYTFDGQALEQAAGRAKTGYDAAFNDANGTNVPRSSAAQLQQTIAQLAATNDPAYANQLAESRAALSAWQAAHPNQTLGAPAGARGPQTRPT